MALRVGFDLDGVLADLDGALIAVAERLCGPDQVDRSADAGRARLRGGQLDMAWTAAFETDNFWETLSETEPGIVARLDREARAHGWHVFFVTQRPPSAGEPVEEQTRRWLARHGYPDATVALAPVARGPVVASLDLDIAVDDRPTNCSSIIAESRARALLVWRDAWGPLGENACPPGIERVGTTGQAIDRLIADGSGPSDPQPICDQSSTSNEGSIRS